MIKKRFMAIIFLLFLTGCSESVKINKSEESSTSPLEYFYSMEEEENLIYEDSIDEFINISIDEINEKLNANDIFFLYIGKKSCPYCRMLVPKLKEAAREENIAIYYLDVENMNEDDPTDIFLNSINVEFVPSLIYFDSNNENKNLNIDSEDVTIETLRNLLVKR